MLLSLDPWLFSPHHRPPAPALLSHPRFPFSRCPIQHLLFNRLVVSPPQHLAYPSQVIIATLTAGKLDSVCLDLFLGQYAEFIVIGGYEVHLAGYFSPLDDDDGPMDGDDQGMGFGDEDDEDEDDEDDEVRDMFVCEVQARHQTAQAEHIGAVCEHSSCFYSRQ